VPPAVTAARRVDRARAARRDPPVRVPPGRPGYLTLPPERIAATPPQSGALDARLDAGLDAGLDAAGALDQKLDGEAPQLATGMTELADTSPGEGGDDVSTGSATDGDTEGESHEADGTSEAEGASEAAGEEEATGADADAPGASAADATPGGRGTGGRALAGGAGAGKGEDAGTPSVATGTYALPRRMMVLPPAALAFDAPRALDMTPVAPAKQPTPDTARYAAVFADATAAAARLHASLLADASRMADSARRAAMVRADRRQANLDDSLTRLDAGFTEARSVLNTGAADALTLLGGYAAAARIAINAASKRAHGAIGGTKGSVEALKTKQQTEAATVEGNAAAATKAVSDAGSKAETALGALATHPETTFGAVRDTMESAQNERIALNMPGYANEQKTKMHGATSAQETAMVPLVTNLQSELVKSFEPVNGWIATLTKAAPDAVEGAKRNSLSQVRKTASALRKAVEAGRASTEAALARQHEMVRAQLISSAEQRAHQEDEMAEQRATADVTAATGLAAAPPGTVKSVRQSLERERTRPAEEFARVVINSATGIEPRLVTLTTEQRLRLARRATDGITQLDRRSDDTSTRLLNSAGDTALRLTRAATDTGAALQKQVADSASGLTALAQPVTQSTARFLPEINASLTKNGEALVAGVTKLGTNFNLAMDGKSPPGPPAEGATSTPVPTPGPAEPPNMFKTSATTVAGAPETQPDIAAFVTSARSKVTTDISGRTSGLSGAFQAFIHNEEEVFTHLRQMLPRQAAALVAYYDSKWSPDLVSAIDFYFDTSVTTQETWRRNTAAAMAYLSGNAAEGALNEMQAAVVLWNDTARIERVQRTLTPAQLAAMDEIPGAEAALNEVRDDIDGVDREVFNALRTGDVGEANALRLREGVDRARGSRGYAGGEATFNTIRDANRAAGTDLLSGADVLGLENEGVRAARMTKAWETTLDAFATLQPLPEGQAATDGRGSALIAYATGERDYAVTTGHGEDAHTEIVREGIGTDHSRLIRNLVTTGADSAATRAALMVVQMNRPDRGLDSDRVDEATYDPDLNPDLRSTDPNRFERQRLARERRDEMYRLYDMYTRGEDAARADPRDPADIRAGLEREAGTRLSSDENRAAYVRSMIRDERADPVAAFTFAVNDWGTNTDVLRRTFSRMTREQVDQAVADYAAAHNGESLYARLGIHGEGNWLTAELSGEERQQITVASMGAAQNDVQRAEIAAMEARLQMEDSTSIGQWLAGDEYRGLEQDYRQLLVTMGVQTEDGRTVAAFDRLGRLTVRAPDGSAIPVGNFNAAGVFQPPAGMRPEALEIAMGQSGISARAYVAATDRVANAITTSLVVTAAIVTTALTGGAAASIWIPVLVTAGAGLAGIAASAAIKGGRYGRDEMLRDLGTTIVQAATAGLGAAAGVALRGGAPALRAVSSRMLVSEKVLERFMSLGGRGGLRALTVADEALIAGGSAAVGGMGQAALDADAWHRGTWGEGIGHAGVRGFLGGALGAVLMRPIMRTGLPGQGEAPEALGLHMLRRGFGSAVSGTTARAVDLGYDNARGGAHHVSLAEGMSELQLAFAQNLIQGLGEGGAERGSDAVRAARAASGRAATRPGGAATPDGPPRPLSADGPGAARVPAEGGADMPAPQAVAPHTVAPHPGALEPAAAAVPPARAAPADVEPVPVPPAIRDTVPELADIVSTGPLRPAAEEVRAAPPVARAEDALPSPARQQAAEPAPARAAEEPGAPRRIKAPSSRDPNEPGGRGSRPGGADAEGEPTSSRRPATDADMEDGEPTQRFRRADVLPDGTEPVPGPRPAGPDEAAPEQAGGRRAAPDADMEDGEPTQRIPRAEVDAAAVAGPPRSAQPEVVEFDILPEMTVMMDADPRNRDAALDNYDTLIRDDPTREVAMYYNPDTGEHIVVQGVETTVYVGRSATGDAEAPQAAGTTQRWKEILDNDSGRWELVSHFHPDYPDPNVHPALKRMPSGESGDMGLIRGESDAAGGVARSSRIHYMDNGDYAHTDFGYDPANPRRPYWIEFENPRTGQRDRRTFRTVEEYDRWVGRLLRQPDPAAVPQSPDAAAPPAATPDGSTGLPAARPPTSGPADPAMDAAAAPVRGTASAVHGTMFTGEAPPARQRPAEVVSQADVTTSRAQLRQLAETILPDVPGVRITFAKSDNSLRITIPNPAGSGPPIRLRVRLETVSPLPATWPHDNGVPAPAHYEPITPLPHNTTDAFVVRISAGTDPLNVMPAIAHELGEIRRVAEARARGTPINPAAQTDTLARGAPDAPLSAHDVGRVEQLRVRMEQVDTHERLLQDAIRANAPPDEIARLTHLRDRLRTDARRLVEQMGLAGDDTAPARVLRITEDPQVTPEAMRAVARAVSDAAAMHMQAPEPDPALVARVAAGDPTVSREEWQAVQRFRRQEERAARMQDAELDAMARTAATTAPATPPAPATPLTENQRAAQRIVAAAERDRIVGRAIARFLAENPAQAAELNRLRAIAPAEMHALLAAQTHAEEHAAMLAFGNRMRAAGRSIADVRTEFAAIRRLVRYSGLRTAVDHQLTLAARRGEMAAWPPAHQQLRQWVEGSPDLMGVANLSAAQRAELYARFLDRNPPPMRTRQRFEDYWRDVERSNMRPVVSEIEGTGVLNRRESMSVLKGGPGGERFGEGGHGANEPGIDIVGFVPTPDGQPQPARVPVMLGDDKAYKGVAGAGRRLEGVSALVENLTQNLGSEARMQQRAIDAQERQGFAVSPDHRAAVRQMQAAATALATLDATPPWPGNPLRFEDPAYIAAVRNVLAAEGISLVVTSAYGDVNQLSQQLRDYGFRIVR